MKYLLILLLLPSFVYAATDDRPNILVLISDDQSADDLSAISGARPHTPALDQIAAQGIRFSNAYVTSPQCSPSRASILTGRSPHATGTSRLHSTLTTEYQTIVESLRSAGYFVGAFRKVHAGETFQARWSYYGGDDVPFDDFFRKRPKGSPFFLWIGFHDPHRPYPLETTGSTDQIRVPGFLPDTPAVRADLANYYTAIERMDAEVKTILALLKTEQLDKNTIVFFIGDNGMPFPGAKGSLYDAGIRVPLLVRWTGKIPAGVTNPQPISFTDFAPTWLELAHANLLPRMEGRSLVPAFNGKPADQDRAVFFERDWHDNLDLIRGVRSGRYLLIQNFLPERPYDPTLDLADSPSWKSILELHQQHKLPELLERKFFQPRRPEVELYDVEGDPAQLHNLAMDQTQANTIHSLQQMLSDWMVSTNDFLPPPIPPPRGAQGEK